MIKYAVVFPVSSVAGAGTPLPESPEKRMSSQMIKDFNSICLTVATASDPSVVEFWMVNWLPLAIVILEITNDETLMIKYLG